MEEATRRMIFWAGYKVGRMDASAPGGAGKPIEQQIEWAWQAFQTDALAKFEAAARGERVEIDPLLVARDGAVVVLVRGEVAAASLDKLLRHMGYMHEVTGLYGVALAGNADCTASVSLASEDEMRAQGWIRADKAREEVVRQQVEGCRVPAELMKGSQNENAARAMREACPWRQDDNACGGPRQENECDGGCEHMKEEG